MSDTEKMLDKACRIIADLGWDCICEDLMCDDGWCEEYCGQSEIGTTPECVKRWLSKQVEED